MVGFYICIYIAELVSALLEKFHLRIVDCLVDYIDIYIRIGSKLNHRDGSI